MEPIPITNSLTEGTSGGLLNGQIHAHVLMSRLRVHPYEVPASRHRHPELSRSIHRQSPQHLSHRRVLRRESEYGGNLLHHVLIPARGRGESVTSDGAVGAVHEIEHVVDPRGAAGAMHFLATRSLVTVEIEHLCFFFAPSDETKSMSPVPLTPLGMYIACQRGRKLETLYSPPNKQRLRSHIIVMQCARSCGHIVNTVQWVHVLYYRREGCRPANTLRR